MNISQNNFYHPQFKGLTKPETPCMFVFDLDGTLTNGTDRDISQVMKTAKERNAKIIYATGRDKNKLEELQGELFNRNVYLPNPDYLIAHNGENIYKNIDGELYKDFNYNNDIEKQTNFNRGNVASALNKYDELEPVQNDDSTVLMYKVDKNSNLEKLRKKVIKTLSDNNITSLCGYQENPDHKIMFLAPFNKASGINYLKKDLNIPNEEILLAGNDNNDISMAKLTESGSKFICLNNSSNRLKHVCNKIKEHCDNVYMAMNNGTNGILEGFSNFIK